MQSAARRIPVEQVAKSFFFAGCFGTIAMGLLGEHGVVRDAIYCIWCASLPLFMLAAMRAR